MIKEEIIVNQVTNQPLKKLKKTGIAHMIMIIINKRVIYHAFSRRSHTNKHNHSQ